MSRLPSLGANSGPIYRYANTPFQARVEFTEEEFEPMRRDEKIIEAAVPRWRQVRI